jgi:cytidylate kinase
VKRAERRYLEDQLKNSTATLDETLTDMIERDRRDTTRADSPLKVAEDAIVIDSTGKSIEQTFEEMLSMIKENSQTAFERCDEKSATD